MIRYLIDVPDSLTRKSRFALRLLLEGEGIVATATSDVSEADLVYSESPPPARRDAVWLPAALTDWEDPALPVHFVGGRLKVGDNRDHERHDPVLATYFVTTGVAESGQERNQFGVPIARGSRLWTKGVLQKPVVALLAREVRNGLEQQAAVRNRILELVPRWPDGFTSALVLTHDVDRPVSRPPAAHYRSRIRRDWRQRDFVAAARGVAGYVRNVTMLGDSGRDPERDPQFGFDGWMGFAEGLGCRSAFYVAVRGAADEFAYRQDVYYDAGHPAIVAAMRRAVEAGFEVGLHASIACRDRESLFAEERARLSQLLDGKPVAGLRHHYWALDAEWPEQTLAAHARAGFVYDSSLGFNDAPGFRRGMALPFRPFERQQEFELDIMQLPPTAMDASVFYYGDHGAQAGDVLEAHLDVVAEFGGCAVLNWHLAQAMPTRMNGAGPALQEILKTRLQKQTDVWMATPSAVVAWWDRRRRRVLPEVHDH